MAAMAEQGQDDSAGCCKCACCCIAVVVAIATIVTVAVLIGTSKDGAYSVTVTGVAGLDPAANLTSSPVFNLTVRIDNARNQMTEACVDRLSTVAVSYGDALLGRGSVPQFCAKEGKVRERSARAWARGVALPPFLRDQLARELAAGEAAVDVKVTTPAMGFTDGDTVFVCNEVKIGGGPAPCRMETVYQQQQQADLGSTG